MQRMQSPTMPQEKGIGKGPASNQAGTMNMGSTMATTQKLGAMQSGASSMDQTRNLHGKLMRNENFNMTMSSPFRDTVARGILTGNGMLVS